MAELGIHHQLSLRRTDLPEFRTFSEMFIEMLPAAVNEIVAEIASSLANFCDPTHRYILADMLEDMGDSRCEEQRRVAKAFEFWHCLIARPQDSVCVEGPAHGRMVPVIANTVTMMAEHAPLIEFSPRHPIEPPHFAEHPYENALVRIMQRRICIKIHTSIYAHQWKRALSSFFHETVRGNRPRETFHEWEPVIVNSPLVWFGSGIINARGI